MCAYEYVKMIATSLYDMIKVLRDSYNRLAFAGFKEEADRVLGVIETFRVLAEEEVVTYDDLFGAVESAQKDLGWVVDRLTKFIEGLRRECESLTGAERSECLSRLNSYIILYNQVAHIIRAYISFLEKVKPVITMVARRLKPPTKKYT